MMRFSRTLLGGRNLVEKIIQRHVVDAAEAVRPGDFVSLRPWRVMTHDNSHAVSQKFRALGAAKVHNPQQMVFALDHDIQNKSEANLKRYATIEEFANEHSIDFYPAGRGIGHQVMVEELYAEPGSLCVASDSHSNMYGGVGCLGTPVVRTDAASIWATGRTWWRIPPIVHVELKGMLPPGCQGKDVIIALCGHLNQDQVLNHAVEFGGEGVASLPIEDRLTIANMSTEWGALCGLFPVDDATLRYWEGRQSIVEKSRPGATPLPSASARASRAKDLVARLKKEPLQADPDAVYAQRYVLDLSKLTPLTTGGNSLKSVVPAGAGKIKVHKAWLVSCVNARAADIAAAAKELRGKKVAPWVEFYVAAASSEVQADAEASGDWQVLLDAGGIVLPPGCGACAGLGAGQIKAGENGIASTNRNFKGRMGSRDGMVYLSSPAVVAASAAEGYIVPPSGMEIGGDASEAIVTLDSSSAVPAAQAGKVDLVQGFPRLIESELLWCGADNISTDGIYHGKHMYEELTKEEMAKVAMENYDPEWGDHVAAIGSPILASGSNFGTGSSREQAAQCLKYAGVTALLAGSYSATYTRNALNNGLPMFESLELTNYLRKKFGSGVETAIDTPTVRTGLIARIDTAAWRVSLVNRSGTEEASFPLVPLGAAAQELIACDGLEPWIKSQLQASA